MMATSMSSASPTGVPFMHDGGNAMGVNDLDGTMKSKTIEAEEDEEEKPAWSDLKTKAGKERKRLPLACIACRRKKIRCSGEKPACKHCLKARIPCVYKVTTRKPAPRTDYMTMLDRRLKRMEERVIKLAPEHSAAKMASIGRSSVKPYVPPAAKANANKKRFAEEAFGNEMNDWANEAGKGKPAVELAGAEAGDVRMLREGSEHLPPPEIQEHLSEVFFEYLYGQSYHVLHKPSFMRKLKAGKVPPVLILTVCALSARFSTHPSIQTEPVFLRGEEWAEPARAIALKRYDEPSITILIVYLLLGLHEFGTCQGGRSWMFGGMALRMAYALQLHRELDKNILGPKEDGGNQLGFTDREIRRRTMWACFLMDRFNSSGTDRPTFSSEESINIQLPVKEFNFQMEIPGITEDIDGIARLRGDTSQQQVSPKDNMDVAAYLIRVISIWGKVVKYVNLGGKQKDPYPIWSKESEFTKLKRQLKDFIEELPERLRYTPETLRNHAAENLANQFLFIHIACSQIVLFLHKFAIPTVPGAKMPADAPKEFVAQSAKTAIEAAGRISMLVKDAAEHRVSAPFAGYCTFAASTIHVWGIFSSNPALELQSKQNLTYGIKYLTQMRRYWGMFHHMVENLKSIYRQHADWALAGPQSGASSNADEMLFQYGDWFDKYPHGVSGVDFEDAAVKSPKDASGDAPLYEKPELQSPEDFFREAAKTVIPLPRKAARKQTNNHASTRSNASAPKKENTSLGIPDDNQQLRALSLSPPNPSQPTLNTTNLAGYNHNFYPDGQGMAAYNLQNQPLGLSELDRHLVFGAYATDFPTSPLQTRDAMQGLPQQSAPNMGQAQQIPHPAAMNPMLWDHTVDYSMVTQGYQDGQTGSAWYLPFNLVPPDIGVGHDMQNEHHANNMDIESGR